MSRILKTAALVVGAVALVATGVGAAAGAGLIGAGIGSAATVAGIAASTLTTIGAIAGAASGLLSLAAGLTAKKPSAQATGSPTDFSADPDAGIPLAIGRTGTAGDITARFGFDTKDKGDNDRQSFVATLSLGPIDAIEGQTVDKASVSYLASGAAIGAFAGFMWSMTQLGAMPEANALGFGAGAGSPPGWTAQHKMSGKAAASWTLRFDPNGKIFANGVPAPMWTLRGAKCYDPTKDSTYPGGAGAHRMADPANTASYDAATDTWEWSEDPFLLGLRWAHGVWQRDRSNPNSTYQRVMGMGANWSGIDVAAFVEGRNVAHANGWKVGGMIYSGDDKWDTMKKILQAGMGEPLALGARISCLVNAPKVSLANITVDDVIGTASVAATQPRRNRINTITPRYRLEENNWQLLPGAPITVPEYVIADRGKRSKVQDYPFIQQTPQVATAVRYDIENAREFGPISLPLKLVWMGYKPGDCVTVTLPEVGLVAQPVLLLNRELDPSQGIVTMTARSETAGKHPYALGQTSTPPPTPGVSGPPLIPVPGANAWAITGSAIESTSGTVPAIVIAGARDANAIDGIVFDYRKFSSGLGVDDGWTSAGIEPASTVTKVITGVQGSTAYQVSVRYSRNGSAGDRLIIGPIGTDGLAVTYVSPGAAIGGTIGPDGAIVGGMPAADVLAAAQLAGDVESGLATAQSAIASANAAIAAAQSDIDAAKKLIDGINETAADAQAHADQALDAIQGAVADASDAKAAADAAQARADQAVSQVGGATSAAADAKAAAAAAQSRADQAVSDITAAGGDIVTLKTLTATQASQISSNASAITNAVGNLATLTTRVGAGGNPNLLTNGSFENGLIGWSVAGSGWATYISGGWGQVGGTSISPADGAYAYLTSDRVGVFPNATYTVAADASLFVTDGTDARVYLELDWYGSDGTSLVGQVGGPNKSGQFDFTSTGENRRALTLTAQAPANAQFVRVLFVGYKATGTVRSLAARQIKLEQGGIATAYSSDASLVQTFKALSDATSQYASLSTIVSTQGASITQNASALSSLGTNVANLTSTVTAQGASITSNASAISSLGSTVASLSSTVATQGAAISSNATAISNTKGDLATLQTKVLAGNANLIPNGGFENGFAFWDPSPLARLSTGVLWGSYVYLSAAISGAPYILAQTKPFDAAANFYYTAASDVHIFGDNPASFIYVDMIFLDANGGFIPGGDAGESPIHAPTDFSATGANRQAVKSTWLSPAGTAKCVVRLVIDPAGGTVTNAGGRQFKMEVGRQATAYSAEASIVQSFKALNTLDTQYASLSSIVSTQGASITQNASALSSLGTNVANLTSTVTAQGSSITTNANAISAVGTNVANLTTTVSAQGASITQNGNAISSLGSSVASLTSTVSAQGSQISSNASAISNTAGNLATLTNKVLAGNANLIPNGGFENGLKGWNAHPLAGLSTGVVWGSYAYLTTPYAGAAIVLVQTDAFSAAPGWQYTVTGDAHVFADRSASSAYIDMIFLDGNGGFLPGGDSDQSPIYAQTDFSTNGANRVALKTSWIAPAGTAKCVVRFVIDPAGGTITGAGCRQLKMEAGSQATPYSSEASAVQTFKAVSTLDTQYASLSSLVSTQGASVTQNANAISSLGTNVSNLSSTVTAQGATISQNASAISSLGSNLASLSSLVNSQGASISQNASAISSTNSNLATLTSKVLAGNANLIPNGGFENGVTGWNISARATLYNGPVWGPYVALNAPVTGGIIEIASTVPFPSTPGATYTAAADIHIFSNTTASFIYVDMIFLDAGGNVLPGGDSGESPINAQRDFSTTGANREAIKTTFLSPVGTAKCVVRLILDTAGGTVNGAGGRLFKMEAGGQATPYSGEASAVQSFQAISNLNQSFASLSSTVSTQGASITQNANALSSLTGNYASLSSTVSAQGTSISQNAQAISDTNGRVASLLSTVSAQGVSISQSFQAISTVQGSVNTALARWAIRLDANGRWIGIEANNNGSYGEIDIVADKLKVSDPDGSVGIQIGGGSIRTYHPNGNLATRQGRW